MQDERHVIVIGSGPGGATAAAFLVRAGVRVTLLEAGSKDGARGLTARIRGVTVASVRGTLQMRREGVRMTGDAQTEFFEDLSPGGLSNHWSCGVPRFSDDDFADAARAGKAYEWPVGYADLAPWYDRVEPLMNIAGSTRGVPQLPAGRVHTERRLDSTWGAVGVQAEGAGRSIVPMPYAFRGGSTVTMSGTAFNAFVRLVQPEERTGRIKVVYDARALRLEWSPSSRRVEAVVYRNKKTGREERLPCRAVVVAAGAINTAQLLLDSKSAEFPDGLGNRHGVLGRYLHDHPVGKLLVDLKTPVSMSPPAYVTRPVLSKSRPLYAAACMQWSGAGMYVRSLLRRHPGRLPWAGFSVFGTMAPAPENSVALDPAGGRNDDGSPHLAITIRHPKEAAEVLNATRDDLLDLFARAGFSPTVRVWHIEHPGSSNHYGGTCRMHASPEYGMVNRWGRLHAVSNVVVGDSAVFTTGPEKNPVVTSMALSARASDRLAEDLRSGAV